MTVPVMDDNDLFARLQRNDQAAFESLASAMVSSDNNTRKQGEDFYQQMVTKHPDVAVRFLATGLGGQPDLRHFCCLYLRKVRTATVAATSCVRL